MRCTGRYAAGMGGGGGSGSGSQRRGAHFRGGYLAPVKFAA